MQFAKKSFLKAGNLKNHMRIHVREKVYIRAISRKSFSLSRNFENYWRIRTRKVLEWRNLWQIIYTGRKSEKAQEDSLMTKALLFCNL